MWDWLQENHGALGALTSVAMLGVWVLYFQLLLGSYRYRLRARILINRGSGHTVSARCLIANMSVEPVYIEAVFAELGFAGEDGRTVRRHCALDELDLQTATRDDREPQWFQGPLKCAEVVDVGSWGALIARAATHLEIRAPVSEVTITAIATYTAEDSLVAARRSYDLDGEGLRARLVPRGVTARQLRSRAARRTLSRAMAERYVGGAGR